MATLHPPCARIPSPHPKRGDQGAEEGNTVDTLARMLGVHLSIKGEVLPENVRKWNVRRFELPRDNRHRDRPIVRDIYAALDAFLAARQSLLAY